MDVPVDLQKQAKTTACMLKAETNARNPAGEILTKPCAISP